MAKIIIIDDDALIRRMVSRVLNDAGHEVLEAKNGDAGLSEIRAQAPDLVITDLLMPDKEGIEMIRELRGAAHPVPILVISGSGPADMQALFLDMALKLGASASLGKPFRAAELLAAVDGLLPPASPATRRT
jgi:DNA-binding response OmpR family regulator